jgi:hypothetical protein
MSEPIEIRVISAEVTDNYADDSDDSGYRQRILVPEDDSYFAESFVLILHPDGTVRWRKG